MATLKQRLYWKAPYFAKKWLVSLYARKLDGHRHGKAYQEILSDIASRGNWSREQFEAYQRRQLKTLIRHAVEKVSYYRRVYAERGIRPEMISGLEDLRQLPILKKEVVRREPECLLDESLDRNTLLVEHTSGTTGTPLTIYRDVWLDSAAYAYGTARWYEVAGLCRRRNPSICSFGHLVVEPRRTKPPFWVENRRWKQLYLSSYHLAPNYLDCYIEEMRRFSADFLECMPSTAYVLARHILDKGLAPIPFKACFTSAETLFDYQREAIKEAFCCKTFDQYGCCELVVFAAECEFGSMHLSPEVGIVEVVDDRDQPVSHGQTGHLICTSLINRVQPFIRYRLGDRGALKDGFCACGSQLPMMASIEGRDDDVLVTSDGRLIGRLDPVFKRTSGIVEAQIIQDDYDKFRIRVVPSPSYTEKDGEETRASLLARVGHGKVDIELVDQIERGSRGKFRAVVCNVKKEQGRLAAMSPSV